MTGAPPVHADAVSRATPIPASYDIANSAGVVSSYGAAYNYGPASSLSCTSPSSGWHDDGRQRLLEAASDGGVFNYGTVPSAVRWADSLNAPVVGLAGTEDMDAIGRQPLTGCVCVRLARSWVHGASIWRHRWWHRTSGRIGVLEVSADGGVFAFGDADTSAPWAGQKLEAPWSAWPHARRPGYWLVAGDGGVFASVTPDSTAPWEAAAHGADRLRGCDE